MYTKNTRISADNLPFQPTSMTFDSKEELWLANNASSSDLIIMDTQTGGWSTFTEQVLRTIQIINA
jgi:hypothetical protein